MRRTLHLSLIIFMLTPLAVHSFAEVRRAPYSLKSTDGDTLYWEESYHVVVGDLDLQIVSGPARISTASIDQTQTWDTEIVSIKVEDEEVMRRIALQFIKDDPITRIPFLGIGGVVSPESALLDPAAVPLGDLQWENEGEDGIVSWSNSYSYSPGDTVLWLNRSFHINGTLDVDCRFKVVDDYQAIEQIVTVTNGETAQYLPFPLETSFSLGTKFEDRGISLPESKLEPGDYLIYPERELPTEWYNETDQVYRLPEVMWDESVLPGMLYMEFDLDQRDWLGVATLSEYSYDMMAGVGLKVLSVEGAEGFAPYCMLLSGEDDHVVFGLKPYEEAGLYDDFEPILLGSGQSLSVKLLWFFPEVEGDTMKISDLEDFADSAVSVTSFIESRTRAEGHSKEANTLAAEGNIEDALGSASEALALYEELGELSDTMMEEGRNVNSTITTWRNSAADVDPHPEKGSRSRMFLTLLFFILLIVVAAAWIYVIEPRRSRES